MTTRAPTGTGRGGAARLTDLLRSALSGHLVDSRADIEAATRAATMLVRCFTGGGKLLIFGNGGSAACAQHLAAELVGRMRHDRAPLPAIALTADTTVVTAIANDFGFDEVFARQVRALGRPGDVALAISTSGRSANALAGIAAARQLDLATLALSGAPPSPLGQLVDVDIAVSAAAPAHVQEVHLGLQHALAASIEAVLFGDEPGGASTCWAVCRRGVVGWAELLRARAAWRRYGRDVVVIHGPFDNLGPHQLGVLASASRLGDVTVAAVYADELAHSRGMAPSPLAWRRAEAVAAVGVVDHVVVIDDLARIEGLAPEFCRGLDAGESGRDEGR